jgi:anti-sigma factor RsiW
MTRSMIYEDTLPIHAYLDGELDPTNALAVERRMANDPALAAEYDRIEALQQLVREHLPRETLPLGLRVRVETSVGMRRPRTLSSRTQFSGMRFSGTPFSGTGLSWRALAASIAVAAFVAGGSTSLLLAPQQADLVRDGVVDAHIRSLMAPQPIDVASSDRHTVKPWFAGRIPQAPRVVDLAKENFPLVGGRLDVVAEAPVPTLVYGHSKHLISVTAVPASGHANAPPVLSTAGGYHMCRWTEDAVSYLAISDVGTTDLAKFVSLFRTTPADL